jgi:tetratricopeptide (TPR) repeat protein/DNA-binding CsgD family transcriptional regulator
VKKSLSLFFIVNFGLLLSGCLKNSKEKQLAICSKFDTLNNSATRVLFARPDSAFHLANLALQLEQEFDCRSARAQSHQIIGVVLFYQGVYQESLRHLLQADAVFNELGQKKNSAETLNQLGLVYFNIKQPGLALEQHRKALLLFEGLKDENGIAYSYGCIGRIYEKKQELDEALLYQKKALDFYEKDNNKRGMATILENIGSIYEDQENYPIALDYFTRSLKLTEETQDSLSMIVNINNIGDNYRKTHQYAEAIEWTRKAVKLAERLKDKYQISSAYKDLSKIYGLKGDYKNAYDNLEIGRNLYQDMYTQDASRQLELFQTLFEIERKNHDIRALEGDRKLSTIIKITLASSLVLLGMLAGVIISRQRLKIKGDKEIIAQNAQFYEAQNKLMKAEIENTHLHEQKLRNELEAKAKSLTSHTLHIISKNKTLEAIQAKLAELLAEGPNDYRKHLKSLVKMIEHNFVQDKDWDDFRQIFEQVHQDFFHRLQQKAPDLTPADLRLASLVRLNIPSKDISILLGISPDSLRIARYRLRKKIGLPQGESLSHFIGSL